MKKNLYTIKKSTKVVFSKANFLIDKTKEILSDFLIDMYKKILSKQSAALVGEGWMERLWKWADNNNISDECLPRNKEDLINLNVLSLSGGQFDKIPKEIGNLINLTSFSIWGNNQLTELPKEIGSLTNLTVIRFIYNQQLTELPKEIGSLVNLTNLFLESNQLTKLPKGIANLTKLTHLDLSGGQLTIIPKEIGNLVNLIDLGLGGNQLTELPKEITNLTNLNRINLRNNPLQPLTIEQLEWIGNIKSVKLDIENNRLPNNNIVHIDPETDYQCEFDTFSMAKNLSDDPYVITSNIIILKCCTTYKDTYEQRALLLSSNNNKYNLISIYRYPDKECKWGLEEYKNFLEPPFVGMEPFDRVPTYDEFKEFESVATMDNLYHRIESGLINSNDQLRIIKYEVFKDNLNRLTYSQFDLDLD